MGRLKEVADIIMEGVPAEGKYSNPQLAGFANLIVAQYVTKCEVKPYEIVDDIHAIACTDFGLAKAIEAVIMAGRFCDVRGGTGYWFFPARNSVARKLLDEFTATSTAGFELPIYRSLTSKRPYLMVAA